MFKDDDYMFVPKELMEHVMGQDIYNLEDFLNNKAADRIVEEEMKNKELKNKIAELENKIVKLENANIESIVGCTIGQDVYVIKNYPEKNDCDKCDGFGYVNVEFLDKLIRAECPFCNSSGFNTTYYYTPIKTKVAGLELWKTKETRRYSIFIGETLAEKRIEDVYLTREECQVACDILNKKSENTV